MKKSTVLCISLILCLTLILPLSLSASTDEFTYEGEFTVLTYNIAGLPDILSGGNPEENTPAIGTLINNFDLVGVQEDFKYHSDLLENATSFPFITQHSGNIPFGDGLNTFSKFPTTLPTRIPWEDTHGFITDGADEMIPKGFTYQRLQVAPQVFIHVYNLHCDAGSDTQSQLCRNSNLEQLAEAINTYSQDQAVLVIGDTNARYFKEADKVKELLIDPTGLKDAWVEVVRGGDFPLPDAEQLAYIEAHITDPDTDKDGPDHEEVDKILFRSGENVTLAATEFMIQEELFVDDEGNRLSDHYAFSASISYSATIPYNSQVFLSDLAPVEFSNGWGMFEYDRSNGEKNFEDGNAFSIEGATFTKGIGVHAPSSISYKLDGLYETFHATIGLDDEKDEGKVVFQVYGDEQLLYESQPFTDHTPPENIQVNIAGIQTLTLVVNDGDNGIKDDHANWCDAYILKSVNP